MPLKRSCLAALVGLVACQAHVSVSSRKDDAAAFRAGTAKVKITPEELGFMLLHNQHKKARGVAADLWARALALEDAHGKRVVLVSLDVLGLPPALGRSIRAEARKRHGLEDGQLLLGASHTHNGPVLPGSPSLEIYHDFTEEEARPVHAYAALLERHVLDAVGAALADLKPARLSWGRATATFGMNRRLDRNPDGPSDPDVPVMSVTAADGRPIAVIFTYACHGTTVMADSSHEYHGDYPGAAAAELEQRHPGIAALFLAGCGGDINPNPRDQLALVRRHGVALADAIDRVLAPAGARRNLSGPLAVSFREIALPLEPAPSKELLEKLLHHKNDTQQRHAREMLRQLARGPLPTAVPYPIAVWRFGADLTLVSLAGEVVVDYALRLKRELGADTTWVAGYAHEVPGYIPSERVLAEGGYEAGWNPDPGRAVASGAQHRYGWPAPYAAGIEDRIVSAVHALVPAPPAPSAAPSGGSALQFRRIPPTPPARAADTFRVRDGFRMELVASEPLVASPVVVTYDEDGRGYVAEMRDYPYTDKASHKPDRENPTDAPLGRVRRLEDTDGDGRFDRSTVFAGDLSWPTGIACWKGGIFVVATPDLWYLKDTDGDGKADVREKVFTGFRKLNVQAVVNNLIWGLDHKIYAAGSSNGGSIRSLRHPDAPAAILARNDFRFDAESGRLELLSGGVRFGHSFDDWGNRFDNSVHRPVVHVVLPSAYLARNTLLPVASPLADSVQYSGKFAVHPTSPPEPWRALRTRQWRADAGNYAAGELAESGVITSASGVTIYRGASYPEPYRGNAFVGEPANNLFMRFIVEPDGVTFRARRADDGVDFVTSTDNWFRPVNFANAPDGTLHVLDMYREFIEHPWSIPDDIHAVLDLTSGRDRGRIWRLVPPGYRPPTPPPVARLGQATTAALVALLESPHAWWRETAHRLIFERQDGTAVAPLRQLLRNSRSPLARRHALWSLEGLGALSDGDLLVALADDVPGMRENAVQLAEHRLARALPIAKRVLALAADADIRVRLQVAFTLGEMKDPRAAGALAGVAARDVGDPWLRAAVLSSAPAFADRMLLRLMPDRRFGDRQAGQEWLRLLALVVGARGHVPATTSIVAAVTAAPRTARALQYTILQGLGEGLAHAGSDLGRLVAALPGALGRSARNLVDSAQEVARDPHAPGSQRRRAIALLGHYEFGRARPTLQALLDPHEGQEIQLVAMGTLSRFSRPEVASILIDDWSRFTPAVRGEVMQVLLARSERVPRLLEAVERGTIPSSQISRARRESLVEHADPAIRQRAQALFAEALQRSRKQVVDAYQPALRLRGDAGRGQQVFASTCAPCHRVGQEGNDVGPNLATIQHWDPGQLLTNILDPNREVAPDFVEYGVELKNGQTVTGLIADETASGITLRRAGGVQETVLRAQIARMASSGLSLMPEGLESAIPPSSMADLIAFLLSGAR